MQLNETKLEFCNVFMVYTLNVLTTILKAFFEKNVIVRAYPEMSCFSIGEEALAQVHLLMDFIWHL